MLKRRKLTRGTINSGIFLINIATRNLNMLRPLWSSDPSRRSNVPQRPLPARPKFRGVSTVILESLKLPKATEKLIHIRQTMTNILPDNLTSTDSTKTCSLKQLNKVSVR